MSSDPKAHEGGVPGGTAATAGNATPKQVPGVTGGGPNSPDSAKTNPNPAGQPNANPDIQGTRQNQPMDDPSARKAPRQQEQDLERAQEKGREDEGKKKPLDHEVMGMEKIKALVDVLPTDTPTDHVLWGYGGYRVKYEDLLELVGKSKRK